MPCERGSIMQGLRFKRKYRFMAIAAALALLFNRIGGFDEAMAETNEPVLTVTSSAQATPAVVALGGDSVIGVTVTASETATLLVDVEIFNAASQRVAQLTESNVEFIGGEAKTIPFTWHVPEDLPAGTYAVSLGIFGVNWQPNYQWNAGATTIQVTDSQSGLGMPRNVQAVPSDTSVKLTWNAVLRADWYEVEADGSVTETVYDTKYTQEGLLPATDHSYKIRARNAEEIGPWSATIPVKTRAVGQGKLRIDLKTESNSVKTQMPAPEFGIHNISDEPINLSQITIRYYFTIDGEKALEAGYWSISPGTNITTKFVKMPIPSEQADYYLEVGFTSAAGVLNHGASADVHTRINKAGWTNFDQSNDYSYAGSPSWAESYFVPAYINGQLDSGTEPVPFDLPSPPAHITGTPTDTAIQLVWDPVEGATTYDINADGTVTSGLTETSYLDQWLKAGTKHTYKLRTHKGDKVSIWSDTVTVKTTGVQDLPAPVNVRGNKTGTSIALTWSPLKEDVTGYEVEVDEVVTDVGTATAYAHTGLAAGTIHTYRVRAKDGATRGKWSELLTTNTISTPTGTFDVQFTVDTGAGRAPISPYIYGTNADMTGTENWKARRVGGNRLTTHNWENNASNAGGDYLHMSDNYVPRYYGGIPYDGNLEEPGIGIAGFHNKSLSVGAYTLATLSTAGYVAADKNGIVNVSEKAPSNRWVPVYAAKNVPFSLTPDLNDNAVYSDEFVNAMVNRFGNASTPTGIKGYAIDNEPALWPETHPLMHPEATKASEVLTKGIDLAKAVKNVDPYAEIYGPVAFSYDEMSSMHGDSTWPAIQEGGHYSWFIDYYLDKFRVASAQSDKRLLDVLDFHWYPEIKKEVTKDHWVKITDEASNDVPALNLARMEAPRSLWDPTYIEDTWIGKDHSDMLPILPRARQSIDQYNPGTRIAITEYNYGGERNIYGGVAEADVLGIFGKLGVHLATFWKLYNGHDEAPYITAAVKLYTNYDGQNAEFGNTKVKSETSNIENSSIYSSVFQDSDDELHLIVINKNNDYDMNAVLNVAGSTQYHSARVFAFDSTSSEITEREGVTGMTGNTLTYTLPKLTVAHIILSI